MRSSVRLGSALLFAGFASIASASIISVSSIDQTGTGLGAVNTILTLQSPGSSTIETGCVAPSGSGTTTSGCGFADSNVQAQFATPTLSALGVSSASDLRIVFNAAEPGSASDIQLNSLVLMLYNSAGTSINTQSLASAILFPSTLSGVGKAGFVFELDASGITSAQSAISSNGGVGSVRVGLGASAGVASGGAGSATGGLETFFITNAAGLGVNAAAGDVPEPATCFLIGASLFGLAVGKRYLIHR